MTLHTVAVYLHVVGALMLFGGQAIEFVGIDRLRRAATAESVLGALGFLKPLGGLYRLAGIALLVTGLYLTFTAWGWPGWIVVSLVLLIALAISGPIMAAAHFGPIAAAAVPASGALSDDLERLTRAPVLVEALYLRCGLALGIVLLMVAKPSTLTSVVAIVLAAGLGLAAGRLVAGRAAV